MPDFTPVIDHILTAEPAAVVLTILFMLVLGGIAITFFALRTSDATTQARAIADKYAADRDSSQAKREERLVSAFDKLAVSTDKIASALDALYKQSSDHHQLTLSAITSVSNDSIKRHNDLTQGILSLKADGVQTIKRLDEILELLKKETTK